KTAILSIPLSALRDSVTGQRLDVIFSLLNTHEREQIELCVDILERILLALSPVYLSQNFRDALQSGLTHHDEGVNILALKQIGRIVAHAESVTEIMNNEELLREVVHCVGGDNMAVAKQAIASLSKLSHSKPGLDKLFRTGLLEDLKDVMGTSDIVRYRVYELVVDIASVSAISLGYCASSGFISQLLAELTGEDVLIRATAIEMVTSLAQSQHGRQHLAQQGVMDKISNMIRGADTDPFSSLYLPMALDTDQAMVGVALDTLGLLGSTVEGKQVEHQTEDLLALTESWFLLLAKQPMDMISTISTQPFPELHCCGLRIFTVAPHRQQQRRNTSP
ncbi:hypothetical protein CRUP_017836, partial [Coryphaenoides rupestris]